MVKSRKKWRKIEQESLQSKQEEELLRRKIDFLDEKDSLFVLDSEGVTEKENLSRRARQQLKNKSSADGKILVPTSKNLLISKKTTWINKKGLRQDIRRTAFPSTTKLSRKTVAPGQAGHLDVWGASIIPKSGASEANHRRTLKGKLDRLRPLIPSVKIPESSLSYNPSSTDKEHAILKAALVCISGDDAHVGEDEKSKQNSSEANSSRTDDEGLSASVDKVEVANNDASEETPIRLIPKASDKKTKAERNRIARLKAAEGQRLAKFFSKEKNKAINRAFETVKEVESEALIFEDRKKKRKENEEKLFAAARKGEYKLKLGKKRFKEPLIEIPSLSREAGSLRTVEASGVKGAVLEHLSSLRRRGLIELPPSEIGSQQYLRRVQKMERKRVKSQKIIKK